MRTSQALVMTPQLMQAIKLLQLSNLDLVSYVEGELERNPLLERSDEESVPVEESGSENAVAADEEWISDRLEISRDTMEERLGTDLDNVYPEDATQTVTRAELPGSYSEWSLVGAGGQAGESGLEGYVAAQRTLVDHLAEQLVLATADPVERIIGQNLIDLVDESGYLTGPIEPVAEKLGAPAEAVERVLRLLQTFDPAGVCARTLTECLTIQLREKNRFDPAMQALVANLPLLARRDLAALRRLCAVGDEDITDMITEIRALNPKPGLAFGSVPIQPVVPDVYVRPAQDGGFIVELNSDTLPKVLVNQTYHATLSKTAAADGSKAFLAENLQSATWLMRALDQRAKTILKVSTEIVKQQDAFFARGVQHLRPLNLKTIADAISMHESTVSRVTANKYMATTRGIFELKYFFTSAIASADGGEAHSAESVRHRIRQMIEQENPDEILSDDTIVERLRGAGIEIARRTVAKYREALRIPSSVQRRREKQRLVPA